MDHVLEDVPVGEEMQIIALLEKRGYSGEGATKEEKQKFAAYPEQGTVAKVEEFFDQYVAFSQERQAPVFCGEFGCFAPFADHEDRVNWYTIVTNLLEERGIARTSWDYYGGFGPFSMDRFKLRKAGEEFKLSFPDDLDMDIIKALGLNCDLK